MSGVPVNACPATPTTAAPAATETVGPDVNAPADRAVTLTVVPKDVVTVTPWTKPPAVGAVTNVAATIPGTGELPNACPENAVTAAPAVPVGAGA